MSIGKDRSVTDLVTDLNASLDRMTAERAAFLDRAMADAIPADIVQLVEELTPIPDDASVTVKQAIDDLREAIKAGFVIATVCYRHELQSNADAMAIINARDTGGDKGREKQTAAKHERYARIRALFDQGIDVREIERIEACKKDTVYRALKHTDGDAPSAS